MVHSASEDKLVVTYARASISSFGPDALTTDRFGLSFSRLGPKAFGCFVSARFWRHNLSDKHSAPLRPVLTRRSEDLKQNKALVQHTSPGGNITGISQRKDHDNEAGR